MTRHQLSTLATLEEMTLFEGKQRDLPSFGTHVLPMSSVITLCSWHKLLGLLSNSYVGPSTVPKVTGDIHWKRAEGQGESQLEKSTGSECCNANRRAHDNMASQSGTRWQQLLQFHRGAYELQNVWPLSCLLSFVLCPNSMKNCRFGKTLTCDESFLI